MINNVTNDVITRCTEHQTGYFYGAETYKVSRNKRFADVQLYENGETSKVRTNLMLEIDQYSKKPTSRELHVGDFVMCMVREKTRTICYIPGCISVEYKTAGTDRSKHFTTVYFNGEHGMHSEHELVKINKTQYGLITDYILERLRNAKRTLTDIELYGSQVTEKIVTIHTGITLEDLDDLKRRTLESLQISLNVSNFTLSYYQFEQALDEFLDRIKKDSRLKKLYKLILQINDLIELRRSLNSRTYKWEDIKNELKILRSKLSKLKTGHVVLAKWHDDGWYYLSTIVNTDGEYDYWIQDTLGAQTQVTRENIIDINDKSYDFKKHDAIIAPHPDYINSYAPGIILKNVDIFNVLIRFYDGTEAPVSKLDVYKIGLCKFEFDVRNIIELEESWVNKSIIALNDATGKYEFGTVIERYGNGRKFIVDTKKGTFLVRDIIFLFDVNHAVRNKNKINVNSCVLSRRSPTKQTYMIGKVLEVNKTESKNHPVFYKIEFINGDVVTLQDDVIYISKSYCHYLTQILKNIDNNIRKEEKDRKQYLKMADKK